MHALGFWHEQMRPDASNYVIMYLQNVSPGLHDNFQPMPTENWGGAGFEYDIRKLSLKSVKFTNFEFLSGLSFFLLLFVPLFYIRDPEFLF